MEINASPGRILQLGYESEDNVTEVVFRYDESWLSHGEGEFKIRVLRPCDTEAYNATEVIDDREAMTLTMTVTDIELSVKGHGEMQVVYIGSDFVKKSPVYRYSVSRAIDSEVVNSPSGNIINEILYDIGDLDELNTTDKSSLVSAINEVNQQGGGSITVDDGLSGTSENPVQNKVIKAKFDSVDQTVAGIGGRLATAETTLAGKADKSYVDTELAGKANTADVNTALSAKANAADVNTALSLKANTADMNTALAGKASKDVVTQSANGLMSSADKIKLDAVYADYTSALTALGGGS